LDYNEAISDRRFFAVLVYYNTYFLGEYIVMIPVKPYSLSSNRLGLTGFQKEGPRDLFSIPFIDNTIAERSDLSNGMTSELSISPCIPLLNY